MKAANRLNYVFLPLHFIMWLEFFLFCCCWNAAEQRRASSSRIYGRTFLQDFPSVSLTTVVNWLKRLVLAALSAAGVSERSAASNLVFRARGTAKVAAPAVFEEKHLGPS